MKTWPQWKAKLFFSSAELKILVSDSDGQDLLKAILQKIPSQPRALVSLLEGLALWQGTRLYVVITVDESARDFFGAVFYGHGLWLAESPLLEFDIRCRRPTRPRRLRGLGDFRKLRVLEGGR